MFSAPSLYRFATGIGGCLLAMMFAPVAAAQTIDVSLNVYYATPSDMSSGGTWELLAKSSHVGIAALQVKIDNINAGAVPQGPRGNVNGSDPAGFSLFDQFPNDNLFMGQEALFLTPGEEQGIFYGVGTLPNGNPGDIGPTFNSLTNLEDSPWATGDLLGEAAWDVAATLASGTFAMGVTPAFLTGHAGSVFTSLGSSTMIGNTAIASVTTIVRTNFTSPLPDYNGNGVVDAADYVVWRKGHPDADGNNDTLVNQLDYDLWFEHFGETLAGAGGGVGSTAGAVPEPSSGILLVFGLLTGVCGRRRWRLPRP